VNALSSAHQSDTVLPAHGVLARRPLAAYFCLAFTLTWLAAAPALLSQTGFKVLPFAVPFAPIQTIGAFVGPFLAAVLVAAAEGRPALAGLWARATHWRFGLQWYVLAVFGYIGLDLAIGLLMPATGAAGALARQWPQMFTVYLPAIITSWLVNAIGEETGWAGFATPRLQARMGPLRGAALLGLLHALWHLPAFFVSDGLGPFNSAGFAFIVLLTVCIRIVWVWLFNRAGGSALIVILLHAALNANSFTVVRGLLPPAPPEVGLVAFGLYLLLAVMVILFTRGRLGYGHARQGATLAAG
jgi:membrane protease YdiL (CAAX protease family)